MTPVRQKMINAIQLRHFSPRTQEAYVRSVESLSKQVIRVLRLLGDTRSEYAIPSVGPEQEYFLVDENYYCKRLDLQMTGRTLFGAPAPKGQELDDHYFGSIKERVSLFMNDLDMELWKLGISAKTKHNEVAPNQYELAVVYGECNVTIDQNHLVMEIMKRVARRHKMVCLLHEKPFARVNGSGKHNNWSVSTDTGVNLLSPGKTPEENKRFLLFVAATIKAVDEHADLLRLAASTAGNDHRLGGQEAPPAIISVYLGQALTTIFEKIEAGQKIDKKVKEIFNFGVSTLPDISKDARLSMIFTALRTVSTLILSSIIRLTFNSSVSLSSSRFFTSTSMGYLSLCCVRTITTASVILPAAAI